MEEEQKNNPLKKLFNSANSVLIILPPEPGQDLLTAGLSLHLSLKSHFKLVQIGCSSNLNNFSSLSGIEEVKESVGNKNLHISFDYQEQDLEKVDYEITADGKFSLSIKPKNGSPIPDISSVKFSYSGADSDLVITIGINSLEELGKIYADEKKFLDGATILSVNNVGTEAQFTPNMLHQANTTFVDLVCLLLSRLEFTPTPEAADNLLKAIYQNTANLTSPKVTPDTFVNIASLMRAGARLPSQNSPANNTLNRPSFFTPPAFPQEPQSAPKGNIFVDPSGNESVPADWMSPKIFKANNSDPTNADKI